MLIEFLTNIYIIQNTVLEAFHLCVTAATKVKGQGLSAPYIK